MSPHVSSPSCCSNYQAAVCFYHGRSSYNGIVYAVRRRRNKKRGNKTGPVNGYQYYDYWIWLGLRPLEHPSETARNCTN